MSNCDGWPSFDVDVEHLPDRRLQLWLRRGPSGVDLGTIDRLGGCYPLIEARVAAYLGPWVEDFYVELHIPRPDYVRIGGRVTVPEDDGRRTEGIVRAWVNGELWVESVDVEGGGFYSPDDATFLDEG